LDSAGLQDGKTLADHRHVALVEVTERSKRSLARDATMNRLTRMSSLLDRNLRHTGEWFAVLIQCRRITDYEDLRMFRHGEVVIYTHTAGVIGLGFEPPARGRWLNARGPDHGFAQDPFTRYDDAVLVD
jgi:hypothetical protein